MERIIVETIVHKPIRTVWDAYTHPDHIVQWNFASPDWHCPKAENDLRTGGRFSSRMEAKDGSMGFDFGGTYDEVLPMERLAYTMGDSRKAEVDFKAADGATKVSVSFDPETINPIEMQRGGWQSILDHFKTYTEQLH